MPHVSMFLRVFDEATSWNLLGVSPGINMGRIPLIPPGERASICKMCS